MKARFLLTTLLAFALCTTGCDKVKSLIGPKEKAQEPQPEVPEAVAVATPTPPPPPEVPSEPDINKNASVVIFCYHSVDEKPVGQYAITPAEFEANLQEIVNHGFTIIGLQDFLAWRRGEKSIPDKSAIITVDDGYNSAYYTVWPIMKKYGYPFTLFVYTKFISVGGKSITWEQLAEMRDDGVDIQNHTYSHQNLSGKGKLEAADIKALGGMDKWLHRELAESKEILENRLGIRVNAIAYPYGVPGPEARAMLKDLGYEAGLTVYGQRVGFDTPFDLIGRYAIDRKAPTNFTNGLRMIGGGGGPVSVTARETAVTNLPTRPKNEEAVNDPKPLISADLSSLGAVEPDSVRMRLSGVGAVPAQYNPKTKVVSYQPTKALVPREYTVIVSARVEGKPREARWSFRIGSEPSAD